ncbi:MAG: polymer-forming cytoskeletal protein [Gammaproteobacteria bacterium]|nr:polymer-forming cytoskeletal protein [Gammaproteobacteria bacterium]MDH3560404.1 polymer-forming cytoskeletal protein [Gammaproteobacteria bacterium]
MLGKGKKGKMASAKIDTIIGQQTRIEGDLHFDGGLHIDGRISGNVIAEGDSGSVLTVSEHGNIEGNVQVPNVILNGTVTGNVHSGERIELAAKARVNGDVHYNLIEMAMGAEVNGSLVHESESDTSVVSFERDQFGTTNGPD